MKINESAVWGIALIGIVIISAGGILLLDSIVARMFLYHPSGELVFFLDQTARVHNFTHGDLCMCYKYRPDFSTLNKRLFEFRGYPPVCSVKVDPQNNCYWAPIYHQAVYCNGKSCKVHSLGIEQQLKWQSPIDKVKLALLSNANNKVYLSNIFTTQENGGQAHVLSVQGGELIVNSAFALSDKMVLFLILVINSIAAFGVWFFYLYHTNVINKKVYFQSIASNSIISSIALFLSALSPEETLHEIAIGVFFLSLVDSMVFSSAYKGKFKRKLVLTILSTFLAVFWGIFIGFAIGVTAPPIVPRM